MSLPETAVIVIWLSAIGPPPKKRPPPRPSILNSGSPLVVPLDGALPRFGEVEGVGDAAIEVAAATTTSAIAPAATRPSLVLLGTGVLSVNDACSDGGVTAGSAADAHGLVSSGESFEVIEVTPGCALERRASTPCRVRTLPESVMRMHHSRDT